MTFRYARHTNNLTSLVEFYTKVLGFEQLGDFQDHDGYNGVFLGIAGQSWHLEFTESEEAADHRPDDDDLLVFYLDSADEFRAATKRAEDMSCLSKASKNPYWQKNGVELTDPDGFGVILTVKES